MPNYGKKSYWNDRYKNQKDKTFDWLENYKSLKPLLSKYISRGDRILILGCGNSLLSEEMYDDGYTTIFNVDISDVVIETMIERNQKARPFMEWTVMDALDLDLSEKTFDVVLDKSTLDAVLCGEMSFIHAAIMLKEVQRVLDLHGRFISISYGAPEYRLFHLRRKHLSFDIECYIMSRSFFLILDSSKVNDHVLGQETVDHYVYICKKKHDAVEMFERHYESVMGFLILQEQEERQK